MYKKVRVVEIFVVLVIGEFVPEKHSTIIGRCFEFSLGAPNRKFNIVITVVQMLDIVGERILWRARGRKLQQSKTNLRSRESPEIRPVEKNPLVEFLKKLTAQNPSIRLAICVPLHMSFNFEPIELNTYL